MSIAYAEPDAGEFESQSLFDWLPPVRKDELSISLVVFTVGTTSGAPLLVASRTAVGSSIPAEFDIADNVVVPESDAALIKWIKDESGLTWDQVARVFDVSRRAVHLWANGNRISARNAEIVREFAALVRATGTQSPTATRAKLLAIGPDGLSVLDRFRRRQYDASAAITGAALTPAELLGENIEAAR